LAALRGPLSHPHEARLIAGFAAAGGTRAGTANGTTGVLQLPRRAVVRVKLRDPHRGRAARRIDWQLSVHVLPSVTHSATQHRHAAERTHPAATVIG
jgi:hypothetical protein